jgi:hypothetical protein
VEGHARLNAKQRRTEAGDHAVERIPLDGIKGAGLPGRAIVVMPSQLSGEAAIDVLLHLHGFTPGYATGDDLGVYKIEAQMAAAGKELLGILPQGSESSDFNGAAAGKAFDADAFIAAVFKRLGEEGYGVPAPGRVIMSSHSGGDQPLTETLKSKPPEKLAGLFLFDTMIASAFGGSAIARLLARDAAPATPPAATETVTVTVRWNHTQPPQAYLKGAFDDHPVDWNADVFVDGTKVGSGDGSLDVKLVKGSKHDVRVVPTGDDYYRAASKKLTAEAGTKDIALGYNRESRWFTDQSWEQQGLDAAKAGDTTSATLLDHAIRVNKLVVPTVKKSNDYFASCSTSTSRASCPSCSTTSRAATRTRCSPSGARRWIGWPTRPGWSAG